MRNVACDPDTASQELIDATARMTNAWAFDASRTYELGYRTNGNDHHVVSLADFLRDKFGANVIEHSTELVTGDATAADDD